jgi:hypothetical protein
MPRGRFGLCVIENIINRHNPMPHNPNWFSAAWFSADLAVSRFDDPRRRDPRL